MDHVNTFSRERQGGDVYHRSKDEIRERVYLYNHKLKRYCIQTTIGEHDSTQWRAAEERVQELA